MINVSQSLNYFEIAALAERLALAHGGAAPIDPEKIAAAEGIHFSYGSFPQNFDGLLMYEEEKFRLVCNCRRHSRGSERSRFTFAHELAHYFIPPHRQALMAGQLALRLPQQRRSAIEKESDLFAANLLMPAALFLQQADGLSGPALNRIRVLAETFGTSFTTTAYRALELDLLPAPAAVLLWDSLGAPAGRRLSTATLELGREYLTLISKPPSGSITARAIAQLAGGLYQAETHIMDWFTDLDGYEREHQISLTEEVVSLNDHGWMTLIHPR